MCIRLDHVNQRNNLEIAFKLPKTVTALQLKILLAKCIAVEIFLLLLFQVGVKSKITWLTLSYQSHGNMKIIFTFLTSVFLCLWTFEKKIVSVNMR